MEVADHHDVKLNVNGVQEESAVGNVIVKSGDKNGEGLASSSASDEQLLTNVTIAYVIEFVSNLLTPHYYYIHSLSQSLTSRTLSVKMQ